MTDDPRHASDPAETYGIPRVQPVAEELLNALATLIVEVDALRERIGQTPSNGRREFHAEQLRQGSQLGPLAMIQDGKLVVKLES